MDQIDLIIIGGGISGLGIAREASKRGLRTSVLEAKRCAAQTSANTLRIIHGGFRYLQTFALPRMMASIRDQSALLAELPDFVKPLPCLMPLRPSGLKSRVPVTAASILYHAALRIGGSKLPPPFVLSGEIAEKRCPILYDYALDGALLWHDVYMVDPDGVQRAVRQEAEKLGAVIREGCPITEVRRAPSGFEVHDAHGERHYARYVVNATGPWLQTIRAETVYPPGAGSSQSLLWCKGFNIVINRQLDPKHGFGIEGAGKRLLFAVPRDNGTAIGTWYVPIAAPSFNLEVTEEEIKLLVGAFNAALPPAEVKRDEITAIDVGVLPMIRDSERGPVLYGRERLVHHSGYIEILSTKYTTFRSQANAVLDTLLAPQ